jgi:hypothetical protein
MRTFRISCCLSFDRWKRDGVIVAWGVDPFNIFCVLQIAILVPRTLVRVRRHIERRIKELRDSERLIDWGRMDVLEAVTRSFI